MTGYEVHVVKSATISQGGLYRYDLTRRWAPGIDWAVFVMLNPSTADATIDDPTIRRCISFAQREGYGGLAVVNLYALRTTRPVHLLHHPDPVGPDNAYRVGRWLDAADIVIAAWGAHRLAAHRSGWLTDTVEGYDKDLYCLGVTADGSPRHPLYLPTDTPLEPWPA